MLITLDPGKKGAGVAVFEDNELTAAWYSVSTSWELTAFSVWGEINNRYPKQVWSRAHVAIEVMHYTQRQAVDPNDLIDVALMTGTFVGFMGHEILLTKYKPYDWKGSVPKPIMVERIKEALSPEEHSRVELPKRKPLHHNVYDAVGIGQYHLRRERRKSARISKQTST